MSSCIFCKIVRKEAPASVVHEDDEVMAFLDVNPVQRGHTLVIPKRHFADIWDIDVATCLSTRTALERKRMDQMPSL